MLVKAKPSAEVAEDSEDEDTPNTTESEGQLTLSSSIVLFFSQTDSYLRKI